MPVMPVLALSYSEHLGSAYWAYTLSCRPTILHGYASGVPHFSLSTAFDTIGLHWSTSFLIRKNKLLLPLLSIGKWGHFLTYHLLFLATLSFFPFRVAPVNSPELNPSPYQGEEDFSYRKEASPLYQTPPPLPLLMGEGYRVRDC